jgi:hypothetical protein
VIEVVDLVAHTLAGWRFLLSPVFRRRTLSRWSKESGLQVMEDIVGAVGDMLVSVLLPLFVWWQLRGNS